MRPDSRETSVNYRGPSGRDERRETTADVTASTLAEAWVDLHTITHTHDHESTISRFISNQFSHKDNYFYTENNQFINRVTGHFSCLSSVTLQKQ